MPGIDGPFCVDDLSAGINVVYGPNGCGKSRTAAAMNTLLWPARPERMSLAGLASYDGHDWRIDVDAGVVSYQCAGADSGPPHLPPADVRDRYNLPLHELLRDDHGGDFAETILRESAGGYDVKAAAEALEARPTPSNPKKEADAVKSAARVLKDAEDAQRALQEEEQQLADLEVSLAEARRAAGRAEVLRAAQSYRDTRNALADAEAALARFPAAVGQLCGNEVDECNRFNRQLGEAQAAYDRSRAELDACERSRLESHLADDDPVDEALRTLVERQRRLVELRNKLEAQDQDRRGAAATRDKCRRNIGPGVSDAQLGQVDAGTMRELADFARDLMRANADKHARDSLHEWLGGGNQQVDHQQASYALRLLWRWLEAPAPTDPASSGSSQLRVLLVAAALLIAAQAVVLALVVHWAFAALALLCVPLLFMPRRASRPPEPDARGLTAAEFAKTGLPGPVEWTGEAVAAAADMLAQQLAAARVDAEKAARWDGLTGRRAALDEALRRLDVRRHFFAAHFGVAPETDPLSLIVLASNVAVWQESDARLAKAQAEYDSALERYTDELAAAAEVLAKYGYAAADVPAVGGAMESLRERHSSFRDATQRRQAASDRMVDAQRQIHSARQQIDSLYARVGLEAGDESTVRRWCEQRPAWEAARQQVERAAAQMEVAERGLSTEPSLKDAPPDQIDAELRDAADAAARAEALSEQTVAIRTKLEAAKKAADLEEALARHAEALAALAGRREDDCGAVAAWVLAEYLRRENRDRHRPAVFHRARELFSRITQGRYRLDFDDTTDPPGFRAADTSTEVGHALNELSSGTRLQLLLSVRVAFVEEQEHAVKLPILLDEALANSDETRARAIIDATIALARTGRQVFYFTAQQDEVAKWKAILEEAPDVPHRLIDLAEVRGLAATERLPLREIAPQPLPKVPEPVGLSREQYAALLQVPAFDPSRAEVGGTHLWHLIDDPAVLHRFLKAGVNTWGQLKHVGEFNAAMLVNGSADALRTASAAARALEALGEAWRVGRGRPVDRQVILDSGAVTANFIDRVCALLEPVDGDAARLVEALEQGHVPRFRADAVANLRAYLCAHGYIDERPRMSAEQMRGRMLAAIADDVRQGTIEADLVDRFLAACGPS